MMIQRPSSNTINRPIEIYVLDDSRIWMGHYTEREPENNQAASLSTLCVALAAEVALASFSPALS
jgi:hypothetical protein